MNCAWENIRFPWVTYYEHKSLVEWVDKFVNDLSRDRGRQEAAKIEQELFERAKKRYEELGRHKEAFYPVLVELSATAGDSE